AWGATRLATARYARCNAHSLEHRAGPGYDFVLPRGLSGRIYSEKEDEEKIHPSRRTRRLRLRPKRRPTARGRIPGRFRREAVPPTRRARPLLRTASAAQVRR